MRERVLQNKTQSYFKMKLPNLSKVNIVCVLVTCLSLAAVVYVYTIADGLKQELANLRTINAELRDQTSEVPALYNEVSKLKNANTEKDTALNELAVKNELLTKKLDNSNKELAASKDAADKNKKAGDNANKEVAMLKTKVADLQQQLNAEKERSESLNGELVELRNSQETIVAESKASEANSQIEDRDAKIADLNKQLDAAQLSNLSQFEDFQKEKANLQAEIQKLKQQIAKANANPREKNLENHIKRLQNKIADLQKRCNDLDQQNRDLRHRFVRPL